MSVAAGFPGHNTAEYLAYLRGDPFRGSDFSLVVLWIGANDCRADGHRTARQACQDATREILARLREHAPRVVLLAPPAPHEKASGFAPDGSAWLGAEVLPALRAAAREQGVEVLECFVSDRCRDGVHLTPEGYRRVGVWLRDAFLREGGAACGS